MSGEARICGRGDVPEHDQNVRDVVHLVVVDEVQLFVRGGHEEQPAELVSGDTSTDRTGRTLTRQGATRMLGIFRWSISS